MAATWQFKALMRKNFLIMKRNFIATIMEIIFPIVLMIIIYILRQVFDINYFPYNKTELGSENSNNDILFYANRTVAFTNYPYLNTFLPEGIFDSMMGNESSTGAGEGMFEGLENEMAELMKLKYWNNINISSLAEICQLRPTIGLVGKDFPNYIWEAIKELGDNIQNHTVLDMDKNKMGTVMQLPTNLLAKNFNTINELEDYIRSDEYGDENNPLLCFGVFFERLGDYKYNYSLHYFDNWQDEGIKDIPHCNEPPNDEFQEGPDMTSYELYLKNGYNYVLKIIYDYILNDVINTKNGTPENSKNLSYKKTFLKNINPSQPPNFPPNFPQISFAMGIQKYDFFRIDIFGEFVGYIVPFFTVIAYMCPLCLNVFRMVYEKETRAKEGMKIMGMGEATYFLSNFIQFFIINIIYSVINSAILQLVFEHIPYWYILGMFWLYGMNIFALAFFFQSFIDKTRIALILSLLIYFVMFFMSIAVFDKNVATSLKILVSLFPPVGVELGVIILGKFESRFRKFEQKYTNVKYENYTVNSMYLMFFIDFFIYLFLGYYLQNIISHDFGIARPFYFLFTKSYWCGSSKKKSKNQVTESEKTEMNTKESNGKPNNPHEGEADFEGEELYKNKTEKDDSLKLRNIVKVFGDGKKAVDGVSFNLYKGEIFALLGHNGAGKSTLISMLSGLYEATEGEAYYDGNNILEDIQMDKFRTILGICPQHDVLFDDLTIREHLNMFCYFKGVTSEKIEEEIDKTLKDFRVENIQDIIAKNLSAGQRRKLSIMISIIGGSKVIFLDEPSSGMDITSRRNLWEILKRCTEGKIIILTTHYMEEASVLGRRIGIISGGKMKCIGTPLFLIERFGKFMSINVTKEEDAENEKIIEFFQRRAPGVEQEILSEEIMFRIPKNNSKNNEISVLSLDSNNSQKEAKTAKKSEAYNSNFSFQTFFRELDDNLKALKIKSYSASMPTLEDVFLNVAQEEKTKIGDGGRKFSETNKSHDKILFQENFQGDYTASEKFCIDLSSSLKKRMFQIFRDLKSFFLEILCPIILIVIGLAVSKVQFIKDSEYYKPDITEIAEKNTIVYHFDSSISKEDRDFFLSTPKGVTSEKLEFEDATGLNDIYQNMIQFIEKIYKKDAKDKKDIYGGMYIKKLGNSINGEYQFVEILNTQVRQGSMFFTPYFLGQIIKHAVGKDTPVSLEFVNRPMPLTAKLQSHSKTTSNYTLVFFVNIAFSLIPANFVTLIVKERINNSKHLMKTSGISLAAYWMSNYIFELIKYYIEGGIDLLLIWAFGYLKDYLYILYLLYGPGMISFTYLVSFCFGTESAAQNGVILINFLFGALGSTVILMLRSLDSCMEIAKILAFVFRLIPSFCFGYGFNELLNGTLLLILDNGPTWYLMKKSEMLKLRYIGADALYLGIETVVYLVIMIIIEKVSYTFHVPPDTKIKTDVNDSLVLKEIDRANQEEEVGIVDENGKKSKEEYSVRIRNLHKEFTKGGCCGEKIIAVKNLSFCIEYGECFGLLGLNGAGKTTTFKCLTQECSPTNGSIFINGIDISERFEEVRHMFGYCPQFDAIFEYMTVYENLEFYAKLKGVKKEIIKDFIESMIDEMSLTEYRNKISGNLSGGNKRKLSVAISMICNPPIILLDEPSTGMDPEARRFMWAIIHKISTRRNKSSVIMTTHAMDEAETLCRRMGIMVNGEFVCLGSSQQIKEKYGYGFEIDIRIKPLNEEKYQALINEAEINLKEEVTLDNIKEILDKIQRSNYYYEIKEDGIGKKMYVELKLGTKVNSVISWCHYVECAMKTMKIVLDQFEEVILTEIIENNFLFKIKRGGENSKSIGFLFGLLEGIKDECEITEYSIQQTSLEQIFNQFAEMQGKGQDEIEKKTEIIIKKDLVNKLTQ